MSFLHRLVSSGPKQILKFSDYDPLFLLQVVLVIQVLSGPDVRMVCEGFWVRVPARPSFFSRDIWCVHAWAASSKGTVLSVPVYRFILSPWYLVPGDTLPRGRLVLV